LAELTTGALILVVGAVFTLLGLLVFPFLCIGVPLLVAGIGYFGFPGAMIVAAIVMVVLMVPVILIFVGTPPPGTPIPPPGQAPAAGPATPGQPPIPAGAKFCTNCGAALALGLSFCPNCGARIAM